jgi:thioredoxin-like negative regulator of GroEL
VDNAPFLVEKMQIQVLPCIVSFVEGVSVDRLVGFEELGFNDNFDTALLEKRLATSGVIEVKESKIQTVKQTKSIMGKAIYDDDEESD